jgi:hypothetical protein
MKMKKPAGGVAGGLWVNLRSVEPYIRPKQSAGMEYP